MKTLILFIAAIAVSSVLQAATPGHHSYYTQSGTVSTTQEPKSVVMRDGKVWLINEGKTEVLTKEIVLGKTTVKPDGTAFFENGQIVVLKEGDRITADGKVVTVVNSTTPEQQHE